MWYRMTPRVLAVVALTGCLSLLAVAADKHEGKVVEASKGKLVMTDMDGSNQHSHMVATDAKITRDGKTAKLDELKKGDLVTVTLGDQAGKEVAKELAARSSKGKSSTSVDVSRDGIRIKKEREETAPNTSEARPISSVSTQSMRASKMIGATVKNQSEENLGLIEDFVLNPHEGTMRYAVLSFGGFLGVGDKWFAIPWDELTVKYDGETRDKFHFMLNVDKEKLKSAPGFDKNHFPDVANPDWASEIEVFYNEQLK